MEKGMISVDRWTGQSQAYFLTHLHADHTQGLSPQWSNGPLFCSPISATLFPSKFPGFNTSHLRVLQVGSTNPIQMVSPTTGAVVRVLVTVIDADHCPGAVMFLFRGEFGFMLYTGDFRWELTRERAQLAKKTLLDALGGDIVNVLYLDNTYCNPSFSFPPREVAAQQVVDIITMHPDHEVVIGIDTLGKEDLLLHIAEALSTKIWVWPERLRTMHLLGFFDVFTTKTCLTRVRAVPRYSLTFDTLDALNTVHPTIGIMPSGLPWGLRPFGGNDGSLDPSPKSCYKSQGSASSMIELERNHHYAYSVTYSEHSCFSELQDFIKIVQPLSITGIVSSAPCYLNPRHYLRHLYGTNLHSDEGHCQSRVKIGERIKAKQNGFTLGCRVFTKTKAKKERKFKFARLSQRRSTRCIIRKEKRGVKITESDGI